MQAENSGDISDSVQAEFKNEVKRFSEDELTEYLHRLISVTVRKYDGIFSDYKVRKSEFSGYCSNLLSTRMHTSHFLWPVNSIYLRDFCRIIDKDFKDAATNQIMYQNAAESAMLLVGICPRYIAKRSFVGIDAYIEIGKIGFLKSSKYAEEDKLKDILYFMGTKFEYIKHIFGDIGQRICANKEKNKNHSDESKDKCQIISFTRH